MEFPARPEKPPRATLGGLSGAFLARANRPKWLIEAINEMIREITPPCRPTDDQLEIVNLANSFDSLDFPAATGFAAFADRLWLTIKPA